jgi:AraC-like DNA-binding protein
MRAGATAGVLAAVAAGGGSPERVLAAAGLTAKDLGDVDRLIDAERVARRFEEAARDTGDPCFGLHLGETYDFAAIGALSYAVLNAPTVGTGLANFERYAHAHMTHGRIAVERHGDEAVLVYDLGLADREQSRQLSDGTAVVGAKLMRRLVGPDWRPRRIQLGHAEPPDTSEHVRLLGPALRFGQSVMTSLVFAAADLDREIADADRGLLPIVERHLQDLLAATPSDADWIAEIRNAVAEAVPDGAPTIQTIAKRMGASVRTLQRRLGDHGVVFKDLVAETRRDLALRYLAHNTAELTEIAFLVGYSELSAFHRAFRKWTGETPQEARRRLTRTS